MTTVFSYCLSEYARTGHNNLMVQIISFFIVQLVLYSLLVLLKCNYNDY